MTRAATRCALQAATAAAAALAVRAAVALLLAALAGPRRGSVAPDLLGQVVMAALAVAVAG